MLCARKEGLRLGMFIPLLEGSWFDHGEGVPSGAAGVGVRG
jgi:hypothetical protein